jgi:hypothetical protein
VPKERRRLPFVCLAVLFDVCTLTFTFQTCKDYIAARDGFERVFEQRPLGRPDSELVLNLMGRKVKLGRNLGVTEKRSLFLFSFLSVISFPFFPSG